MSVLSWIVFASFFLLCYTPITSSSSLYKNTSRHLCVQGDRFALLQLKADLFLQNAWEEENDCCGWEGVRCNLLTGHVIQLVASPSPSPIIGGGTISPNSSLFLLRHLELLDLSHNYITSSLPSNISALSHLRYLDLSSNSIDGEIPNEIGQLSRLASLDLSDNNINSSLPSNISALSHLRYLDLSSNWIDGEIPIEISQLFRLTSLDLSDNTINSPFPSNISALSHLRYLNLSSNWIDGEIPIEIGQLSRLISLDLSYNYINSSLPSNISALSRLRYLHLSSNWIDGEIPTEISQLSRLIFLDLSGNRSPKMPDIDKIVGNLTLLRELNLSVVRINSSFPDSLTNLSSLVSLDLSRCLLKGNLPNYIGNLPRLQFLELSRNTLSANFTTFRWSSPFQTLSLSNCDFTGSLTHLFGPTHSLEELRLDGNSFYGPIPPWVFNISSNEGGIDLSNNEFSGKVDLSSFTNNGFICLSNSGLSVTAMKKNDDNLNSCSLTLVGLSSCNIGIFPEVLRSCNALHYLDLSKNSLGGEIPHWLREMPLDTLNLSYNNLVGNLGNAPQSVTVLDIRSNMLGGRVPDLVNSMSYFDASNNQLSGEVPSSFCNMTNLNLLDLSNNRLHGRFPTCLTKLFVLNLRSNQLHGVLPSNFLGCYNLHVLDLNGNRLEGPIPQSLAGCQFLEVLDLGNNMFNHSFPYWLDSLQELQLLVLRNNSFHGVITGTETKYPFPKLRIADFSENNFHGPLPRRYIENFKRMQHADDTSQYMNQFVDPTDYRDSTDLYYKDSKLHYQQILTTFATLDLSSNRFDGEIPESIGNLISLNGLNLSHNKLTGPIPSSVGNLTGLESLDLSSNMLSGNIPQQIASLSFLSCFNVSENQLVGHIPQGKQLDTFQNDSYLGNPGLCGFPLPDCGEHSASPSPFTSSASSAQEGYEGTEIFEWKAVLMGYGTGIVFGFVGGYYLYLLGKPVWLMRLIYKAEFMLTEQRKKRARRCQRKKSTARNG